MIEDKFFSEPGIDQLTKMNSGNIYIYIQKVIYRLAIFDGVLSVELLILFQYSLKL